MWCLPLILLVILAINHRWRILHRGQDSWKGGGFSMFSEVVRNSLITELWIKEKDSTTTSLQIADQMDHHLRRKALAIPTPKHLNAWACWVADAEWTRCGNFVHLPFARQDSDTLSISKVTVRRLYLDFNGSTGRYTARDLETYTVDCQHAEPQVVR